MVIVLLQYGLGAFLFWRAPYTIIALAGIGIYILLWLMVLIDAARLCRRTPLQVLRPYQRWYAVVPITILLVGVGDQLDRSVHIFSQSRSFHSPGLSMVPTLRPGDYFMVQTRIPLQDIRRGDVIVYHGTGNNDYVKRVAGLPGDSINVQENLASVVGIAIQHEKVSEALKFDGSCGSGSGPRYRETWFGHASYLICTLPYNSMSQVSLSVPDGHVFVLGDNRSNSLDSRAREVGPIPVENIIGKATYIYWSKDWRRIGTRLD